MDVDFSSDFFIISYNSRQETITMVQENYYQGMKEIYQTDNFVVVAPSKPLVSREEGGHLKIYPKERIKDRTEMTKELAQEFIELTMLIGKALTRAMTNRGLEITRINYQEMGNWAFKTDKTEHFHLHIFGRAKSAKHQPYTEAVYLPDRSTGFYDEFKPLNQEDITEIKKQITLILRDNQ